MDASVFFAAAMSSADVSAIVFAAASTGGGMSIAIVSNVTSAGSIP